MGKYKYIKAKPISYGNERPYTSIRYICIHFTGNRGDTARNNADFFSRHGDGNTRNAGAHFFVDQNGDVIKSIAMKLTAWSVGGFVTDKDGAASYYLKCTNSNSVSIELCDCATKDPSAKMVKATRELVAYIRKTCPNANTIIRHWDVSGKPCPGRMTGVSNPKWINFKKAIDTKETTPASKTVQYPNVTLRYGNTGNEVKKLQRCLNKIMGAGLDVDGSFGPATLNAVRRFQEKYRLEVDGTVGPKTRAKIKKLIS